MNDNKKPFLNTDTDLHFSLLADNSKLKPKEKIINLRQPIDINSDSELSDFNSDKKVRSIYSESSISSISSKSAKSTKSAKSSKSAKSVKSVKSVKSDPPKIFTHVQTDIPKDIYPKIQPEIPQQKAFPPIYIEGNPLDEEKKKKYRKMELLAKLFDIEKAGRTLTKKYNINSDLEEMEMEILYQSDLENRKYSVNLSKSFLLNAISAIEFLNTRFDPFGVQLKGWSEQMKTNSENYDDVFGEIYEKYKGPGTKMEPEIKITKEDFYSSK